VSLELRVRLKPCDKRTKQLIKEHGAIWIEVLRSERVICFENGPGVFVVSENRQHSRWVKPENLEAA
jgi:hypothetical protein